MRIDAAPSLTVAWDGNVKLKRCFEDSFSQKINPSDLGRFLIVPEENMDVNRKEGNS
jgi:hypothetical protein